MNVTCRLCNDLRVIDPSDNVGAAGGRDYCGQGAGDRARVPGVAESHHYNNDGQRHPRLSPLAIVELWCLAMFLPVAAMVSHQPRC